MNDFSKWIISILGVVLVGFVAELFLAESKTGKFVRTVCATVTVLIIVTPLPALFSGKLSFANGFEFNGSYEIDGEYIDFINEKKLEIMQENLQKVIEAEGVSGAVVSIKGEWDSGGEITLKQVEINLSKSVIHENNEHINKYDRVRACVMQYLMN